MRRLFFATLLIIAGCKSFDVNSAYETNLLTRLNNLTPGVSDKVNISIQSLGDTLVYPRSIVANNKTWKTVGIKDWTSGFFPGILWYMSELTNDEVFKINAKKWTEGLAPLQDYSKSHDVGFMIFCSYGNGFRLTKNEEYHKVILQTARTLTKRFNPVVGAIRSWDHNKDKWDYPVIIDNMMNLELLFWASQNGGTKKMYDIAFGHAEKTMLNHFREDGSTYHVVNYDTTNGSVISRETHQGFANSSCWARGQAWAIYGFTMAYRFTRDERFLQTAQKAANYFIAHLPNDKIPYWDFNAPNIPLEPRDASAASIACSALLELSSYGNDNALQKKYFENGEAMLESLSSDPYYTEGTKSLGLNNHAVGNKPGNGEVDVSLIYGDYYFLEAIVRYKNIQRNVANK